MRVPVLWICGPPGVGKTAAGWHIHSELVGSGVASAYVDIDQLGMCFPEVPSDPDRHRLKARNLDAALQGFEAAGAECVVVSGVVDAVHGPAADDIPHGVLTVCRLRADADELEQRLLGRVGRVDGMDGVLLEARRLDASAFADTCIETSGRSVAEAAWLVRESVVTWPPRAQRTSASAPAEQSTGASDDGQILWLSGATGVGTSTVGFRIYQQVLRRGLVAAYVDFDQLGFCTPAPEDDEWRARILGAMWHNFRSVGAPALVVVGRMHDEAAASSVEGALRSARVTWCRLHAGRDELTDRIMQRGRAGSWPEPGDALLGRSSAQLGQIAAAADTEAQRLELAGFGVRIDTAGRTIEETADLVATVTGWPAVTPTATRDRG